MSKKTIDIKFTTPRMTFKGNYEINGRLLFLPIQGEGPANVTFGKFAKKLTILK